MFKSIAIIAAAVFSFAAQAGEMRTTTDSFTGETKTRFVSTFNEFQATNIGFTISHYDGSTIILTAGVRRQVMDCDKREVLLKDSAGVVHRIKANSYRHQVCTMQISPDLLKNSFSLRLPIYPSGHVDGTFDTSTMDVAKLN